MKRPIFNPEYNWGHVLMAASFLASSFIYGMSLANDLKIVKREVDRHEAVIAEISKTQTLAAKNETILIHDVDRHENILNELVAAKMIAIKNQAMLVQQLADHLEEAHHRSVIVNPDRKP